MEWDPVSLSELKVVVNWRAGSHTVCHVRLAVLGCVVTGFVLVLKYDFQAMRLTTVK